MIRARIASLALLLACGGAACGIPADDDPRAIPEDRVPADAQGDIAAEGDAGTSRATLYFTHFAGERGDVLMTIERDVPSGGSPWTPVLEALLEGVLDTDAGADDVVTKIPANTALAGQPEMVDGTLIVDLNAAISGVQGDGARLAYGQLTCTADALADVDGVLFTREGEPLRPPAGDGDTSTGPLTCDSYTNLLEVPPG